MSEEFCVFLKVKPGAGAGVSHRLTRESGRMQDRKPGIFASTSFAQRAMLRTFSSLKRTIQKTP